VNSSLDSCKGKVLQTTDSMFALRILMEKYRDGQKELHCVFVDLEKDYDRVQERNYGTA